MICSMAETISKFQVTQMLFPFFFSFCDVEWAKDVYMFHRLVLYITITVKKA
jgi:hypothetical protein